MRHHDVTAMTAPDSASIREMVRRSLGGRDTLVLAVSGGIDSMVLLDAASRVIESRRLVIAAFDHGTGPAATTACALVADVCGRRGIECVCGRATGVLETEAELRAARWRFLRDVASARGATIATAHTLDDQLETVLMRVMRGAGARGIAALFAESGVERPLLSVARRAIVEYAARHGLQWIEDPSNSSLRFFRNRVRHELLPALLAVRPALGGELLALSARAAEWRRDVDHVVRDGVGVRSVADGLDVSARSIAELSDDGLAVVWPAAAALGGATLDRRAIARLATFTRSARVGARAPLAGGWTVTRSRDAFQLRASGQGTPGESPLPATSGILWGTWSIHPTRVVGADAWSAWLPSDGPLTIRSWRAGDVLIRSGGSGRQRKVKYLLSKAGVTGHERAGWPVVLSGDEIVWVPGVGRNDAATVRSGRPVLAFACEHNR
jgi:tRNA(Ile)-lysidine synthase